MRPYAMLAGCAALALASVSATHFAQAQTYPQRTVSMIVSQAAGASPDVMARLLADRLSKSLGQGVIVENKPGGGNVVGTSAAARSAPDGYTLFFATSAALVTNPFMMKKLSYDPVQSFVPITFICRSHQILVVHPDVPAKTLADLVALDKKDPGKLSIGVDSPRNLAGVTAQALNHHAGTTMVLVPYPNITTSLQDVMTARIQAGVFSVSISEALIREGKLRAVAVASAHRSKNFPQVPTIAETIPGFDFNGWFMLMAPAGTPADIVQRLNTETHAALKDEKLAETAAKLGFEIAPGTSAEAAEFLKQQLSLWGKITADLKLEAL